MSWIYLSKIMYEFKLISLSTISRSFYNKNSNIDHVISKQFINHGKSNKYQIYYATHNVSIHLEKYSFPLMKAINSIRHYTAIKTRISKNGRKIVEFGWFQGGFFKHGTMRTFHSTIISEIDSITLRKLAPGRWLTINW